MAAGTSEDLVNWDSFADGVRKSNPLFDNLFDEEKAAFSYVGKNEDGGYSVWAPNVIYNKAMGKYVMYFCTTSSYIKSNLCFATADDPKVSLYLSGYDPLFRVYVTDGKTDGFL